MSFIERRRVIQMRILILLHALSKNPLSSFQKFQENWDRC